MANEVTVGSQKLTRDQLSKILPDLRSIRFFENLIADLQNAASSINDRDTVNVWTKNQSTAQFDLTDAPVVALDASQSNAFRLLTKAGLVTRKLANPTNATAGMLLSFEFVQPAAGGCALTFDTLYDFGPQGVPSLSSSLGAIDFMLAYYDGTKMVCFFRSAGGSSTVVQKLTDAPTINFAAANNTIYQLLTTSIVGSTRTIANPTGLVPGQTWNTDIAQPPTGGGGPCAVVFGSAFKWGLGGNGTQPAGSTTAGSIDTYGHEVRSDLSIISVLIGQSGPTGPAGPTGPQGIAGPAGSGNGVNVISAATYTVVVSDSSKLLVFTNATGCAVSVPQATGSFVSPFKFSVANIGAGTVTLTPTTSTVDGASSLAITNKQGADWSSDSTNWYTQRGIGGGGSGGATATVFNRADAAGAGVPAFFNGGEYMAAVGSAAASYSIRATGAAKSSGKYYVEFVCVNAGSSATSVLFGFITSGATLHGLWTSSVTDVLYRGNGQAFGDGGATYYGSFGAFVTGDIIGMAIDIGNTVTFYRNNTALGTVGYTYTSVLPYASTDGGSANVSQAIHCSAANQSYAAPSGYAPWG